MVDITRRAFGAAGFAALLAEATRTSAQELIREEPLALSPPRASEFVTGYSTYSGQVQYLLLGQTPNGTEGGFASGTLNGPNGNPRVYQNVLSISLAEQPTIVAASGNKPEVTTSNIVIVGVPQGSKTVVADFYVNQLAVTESNATTQFKFVRSVPTANIYTSSAANQNGGIQLYALNDNNGSLLTSTNQSDSTTVVNLKNGRVASFRGGFSPEINVSMQTSDTFGHIAIQYGDSAFPSGFIIQKSAAGPGWYDGGGLLLIAGQTPTAVPPSFGSLETNSQTADIEGLARNMRSFRNGGAFPLALHRQ